MTGDAPSSPAGEGGAFHIAGASDVGTVRGENQDRWEVLMFDDGCVALILADGMGGHHGGGEAADDATTAAALVLRETPSGLPAEARINDAAAAASSAVADLRQRIGGDPGTTLVVALLQPDGRYTVGNIGDSRAYVIRGGEAAAVTSDHSWVGEQVRLGLLDPAEARTHPRRNIITRAVMGNGEAPDITSGTLDVADCVLLCSDGVWEPLSDAAMAQVIAAAGDDPAAVLCQAALEAGSRDNVTAVVARRLA